MAKKTKSNDSSSLLMLGGLAAVGLFVLSSKKSNAAPLPPSFAPLPAGTESGSEDVAPSGNSEGAASFTPETDDSSDNSPVTTPAPIKPGPQLPAYPGNVYATEDAGDDDGEELYTPDIVNSAPPPPRIRAPKDRDIILQDRIPMELRATRPDLVVANLMNKAYQKDPAARRNADQFWKRLQQEAAAEVRTGKRSTFLARFGAAFTGPNIQTLVKMYGDKAKIILNSKVQKGAATVKPGSSPVTTVTKNGDGSVSLFTKGGLFSGKAITESIKAEMQRKADVAKKALAVRKDQAGQFWKRVLAEAAAEKRTGKRSAYLAQFGAAYTWKSIEAIQKMYGAQAEVFFKKQTSGKKLPAPKYSKPPARNAATRKTKQKRAVIINKRPIRKK